jgi:hypothetical protein
VHQSEIRVGVPVELCDAHRLATDPPRPC